MRKLRVISALLSVFLLISLIGVSVAYAISWQYYFPITIIDTSNTSRTYVPIVTGTSGQTFIDAGYLVNGTESNMQDGTTSRKFMVATGNITTVVPSLPSGGMVTDNFYTGYSPVQTTFPIITGHNGYITVADNNNLELTTNGSSQLYGYVDTSYSSGNISLTSGDNTFANVNSNTLWRAQSFSSPDAILINSVRAKLYKTAAQNPGIVTLSIRATDGSQRPTGGDLTSGTLNGNLFTDNTAGVWYDFNVDNYIVSANTSYALVLRSSNALDYLKWRADSTSPTYSNGCISTSTDSGATWTTTATWDAMFQVLSYAHVLVGKQAAFHTYVSANQAITSEIVTGSSVTATGITSGETTVETRCTANYPQWATGSVMHFDGTGNAAIDAGVIYNATSTLWVGFWWKLDADYVAGAPANMYLFGKRIDAGNKLLGFLDAASGKLQFAHTSGGVFKFSTISTATHWDKDVWHYVLFSISDNGTAINAEMIIDGENPVTAVDATRTPIPNGANFTIGNFAPGGGATAFHGNIANFVVGTDNLTATEKRQLFYGTAPADATDYWYIDEGTGTAITSYGTVANPGTAGAGTSWLTATRTSSETFITFVALPDTQKLSELYPAVYNAQTQWIVDNEDEQNIAFVVHEGDIVNDHSVLAQWTNAKTAMDILKTGGVPYSVVPGNHDTDDGADPVNYNTYFPYTDFVGANLQVGHYPGTSNENNYVLLTAGGENFVILNLDGWDTSAPFYAWANGILTTYAAKKAIIVTHAYITTNGNISSTHLWDNIIKTHSNVIAVISGHFDSAPYAAHSVSIGTNGNIIYNLQADYQSYVPLSNGFLELYRYYPSLSRFQILTYSPYLDEYLTANNFEFETNVTGRPCDFTLQVGNSRWGKNLKGVGVPPNTNNWILAMNDVAPYITSYKHYKGGLLTAYYEPNAMINGSTLPDRSTDATDNPGTIHWGSNDHITIKYGAMVGFASTSLGGGAAGAAYELSGAMPSAWYGGATDATLAALHVPFYDTFHVASVGSGIPTQNLYFIVIFAIALALMLFIIVFTRSAFLAILVLAIILFMGSEPRIVPMWIPMAILVFDFGIMFLYRQVTY